MALIEIEHLTFSYPHAGKPALDDVSLDIESGSLVLLGGRSGAGKSTLLRHLTSASTPEGERSRTVRLDGVPLEDVSSFSQMSTIAFVSQNPGARMPDGKVIDALTRRLVRINCDQSTMRSRVAEATEYFGISSWLTRDVGELSHGQRQLLNLASAMVLNPRMLIFDDPTSQLDPIAASTFLSIVRNLYTELKVTVIMNLRTSDEAFPSADDVIVMDAGRILHRGAPRDIARLLYTGNDQFAYALPSAVRIFHGVHPQAEQGALPLSVGQARDWMMGEFKAKGAPLRHLPDKRVGGFPEQPVIKFENVGLDRGMRHDVLKDVSLTVTKGCVHALVGANGSGKSTLLDMAAGLVTPDRGGVSIHDSRRGRWVEASQCAHDVALLPQDVDGLFEEDTLRDVFGAMVSGRNFSQGDVDRYVDDLAKTIGVFSCLDAPLSSLSFGERQLGAIGKTVMRETAILLLDEPTKGIDPFAQRKLGKLLHELAKRGVSILIASQDLKFCAEYATSVSLLFDGKIVTTETPQAFFSSNILYTTQASRISRGLYSNSVTDEEVIVLCLENGWQK